MEPSRLYQRTVQGADVERVSSMRHEAVESGGQSRVPGDPNVWFQAASVKLDRLRAVEQRLSADVVTTSASIKASADRRALLYTLLLLAALALAVGVSLATARSLILRLGRLKDVAHEVAERKLPEAMARLREGEGVDLAEESATAVDVHARDEIGQLGEAFSFVHRVALELAGKEAALRRSVGEMFLNLARRSQSLVERQLELIADLGSRHSGQDVLVELSELDHLAARMRRNAENLIVLSGTDPVRRRRGPVTVGDVVSAAVDEVREHGRVELLGVQHTMIAGHAAPDVIRLLAELVENALSFSAPGTKALVAGQALPTTYLLEIEDQGIGMSDEQLAEVNERLSEPPDVDLAHAKMLGFFVVGQLAARHGIKVQLRHSRYGGVAALVLLPAALVVQPEDAAAAGAGLRLPGGARIGLGPPSPPPRTRAAAAEPGQPP